VRLSMHSLYQLEIMVEDICCTEQLHFLSGCNISKSFCMKDFNVMEFLGDCKHAVHFIY
jgi:hypothetical protein